MIRCLGDNIYTDKINKYETEVDQSNLIENMVEFTNKSRPKPKEGKENKEILLIVQVLFMRVEC